MRSKEMKKVASLCLLDEIGKYYTLLWVQKLSKNFDVTCNTANSISLTYISRRDFQINYDIIWRAVSTDSNLSRDILWPLIHRESGPSECRNRNPFSLQISSMVGISRKILRLSSSENISQCCNRPSWSLINYSTGSRNIIAVIYSSRLSCLFKLTQFLIIPSWYKNRSGMLPIFQKAIFICLVDPLGHTIDSWASPSSIKPKLTPIRVPVGIIWASITLS